MHTKANTMNAQVSSKNFCLATEEPFFRTLRRENAYKAIPRSVRHYFLGWNDETDTIILEVSLEGPGSARPINIRKTNMWDLVAGTKKHDLLESMLSRSICTQAIHWSEEWWYVFAELTTRAEDTFSPTTLQEMGIQNTVKSLSFPTKTVLCQVDMLPTYKATYVSLLQFLPPGIALKATQEYIYRAHTNFVDYRADEWTLVEEYVYNVYSPLMLINEEDIWERDDEGYVTEENWD